MNKLKILKFWVVAFYVIIKNTLRNNEWHMIYVDFHYGDDQEGFPIRKQLVARRTASSFDIYWQDLKAFSE